MKRRKFLELSGIGVTGLSLQPLWDSDSHDQMIYSFPQMVGEVSQTSAILQARLSSRNSLPDSPFDSPEAIVRQDIPGVPGIARFEIAKNSNFSGLRKTPWQRAEADHDFIIKHKIEGLEPGVSYYLRVRFGPSEDQTHTGPVSQFTTLSSEDTEDAVSFVVSSCMCFGYFFLGHPSFTIDNPDNWKKPAEGQNRKLGYPALEVIENLQPAFWVLTGDNVYYDQPKQEKAKTKEELRAKWHRQMALPRIHSLLQHVPTYFMVDDHDYRYNDSDNRKIDQRPSPELAKAIFREQVPVIDPLNQEAVTYRTHKVNKLLQIWMLEGRDYRDSNDMPDGSKKSIWGKKQFQWLKKTLLSSDAVFKLLVVPTPLIGPDDAYKHDNHTNYGGFRYERDQFFSWLKKHDFLEKNFYIITGDRHWQYHSIHPIGFEEFGTGTLTPQHARYGREPGDKDSTDPMGLVTQPYIQQQPTAGFMNIRVEPPTDNTPATLNLVTIDDKGNVLYTETKESSLK